jgi:hypothetical protein
MSRTTPTAYMGKMVLDLFHSAACGVSTRSGVLDNILACINTYPDNIKNHGTQVKPHPKKYIGPTADF